MATKQVRSMVNEVSICNQALGWLGANSITSLEEDSTEAELCRENYPFLRDAVMEDRMWTFATVRHASTSTKFDEWGVQYVHSKPQEWLKVFRVYKEVSSSCRLPDKSWRMEEGFVVSDYSIVYMWGVKRVTDTGKFSNMFSQTLATRIAHDLCTPLTQNTKLKQELWADYEKKLDDAAARDGQQGANDIVGPRPGRLVGSRSGGYVPVGSEV